MDLAATSWFVVGIQNAMLGFDLCFFLPNVGSSCKGATAVQTQKRHQMRPFVLPIPVRLAGDAVRQGQQIRTSRQAVRADVVYGTGLCVGELIVVRIELYMSHFFV